MPKIVRKAHARILKNIKSIFNHLSKFGMEKIIFLMVEYASC